MGTASMAGSKVRRLLPSRCNSCVQTSMFRLAMSVLSVATDFPSAPPFEIDRDGLMVAQSERGVCRVVCFSPRHDLTIPRMQPQEVRAVIDVWADQYRELGELPWIQHVQIFENRGALMGASNPHPHCQIWANETLPNQPARELAGQSEYLGTHQKGLLCSYLAIESDERERMVAENEHFVALVPSWAVWPDRKSTR